MRRPLDACASPLQTAYDVAMLDLDGVVYVGPDAVPEAPDHLAAAATAGLRLAYVTNNAARPPAGVAAHLRDLGIPAADADVVTSAQAAARVLAEQLASGSAVFVIGGEGLFRALEAEGLRPVQDAGESPQAVVSGYHPDLRWATVSQGAILVKQGLPWVASNTDLSVPTPLGPGPGNGVLVRAVQQFTGVDPVVAGKPESPLFHETQRRVGGDRPLVVGDRLDTDIAGAIRAGYDSLLVLTGVTRLAELVAAQPDERPTYLSATLSGLAAPHPRVHADAAGSRVGGWSATIERGAVLVSGDGAPDDWWRAIAAAGWAHLDATGEVADVTGLAPPAGVGSDV